MKKIAIIVDSSISFTKKEAEARNLHIIPLTIIHNNKEFLDQETISSEDVKNILLNNELLTTSQPNIGYLLDKLNNIARKKYDHVFILPLSHHLSGTYNSFKQALQATHLENYSLIYTETLAGPVQRAVDLILQLNAENKTINEIKDGLNKLFNDTESYIIPQTLKQLKASGRISRSAATMASLLRIKPILKLENKGTTIEKFSTARTNKKAMDLIVDNLVENNVNPEKYSLNFLHSEAETEVHQLINILENKIGTFDYNISALPAVLTAHAGLGTVALQYTIKVVD